MKIIAIYTSIWIPQITNNHPIVSLKSLLLLQILFLRTLTNTFYETCSLNVVYFIPRPSVPAAFTHAACWGSAQT